jgi:hypothetical protein
LTISCSELDCGAVFEAGLESVDGLVVEAGVVVGALGSDMALPIIPWPDPPVGTGITIINFLKFFSES